MMTPRPHLPPPQTTRPPSIRRHLLSFSPKTEKRIFSGGCSFRDVFFPRTLDFSCFSGDRFIFIFFSFAAATARSEGGKRQRESKADEATVIYLYHLVASRPTLRNEDTKARARERPNHREGSSFVSPIESESESESERAPPPLEDGGKHKRLCSGTPLE